MKSYTKGSTQQLKVTFGINESSVRTAAPAGATTLALRWVTDLAGTDTIIIEPGTEREETAAISSISGTTLTLTAGLMYSHSIGAEVLELVDPTTVTLKVKDPANTVTTYTYALATVTKLSKGVYYKNVAMASAGTWWYRWEGTGTAPGAAEQSLNVETSQF